MASANEPVVLELAPLPREKIGPFLLLGLEKDADKEPIEANWAKRVIWARKNQLSVPLEYVNWAREILADPDKRVRADVTSLNADLTDRVVFRLEQRYGVSGGGLVSLLRGDSAAPEYAPAVEAPDPETVRAATQVPPVPEEVPAVRSLLAQLVAEPIDPWALPFPEDPSKDTAP